MSAKPTISLVIPAYNEEKYIGACLESVLANAPGFFQDIVVVDNQSTDNTRAVAERFAPAVRVVHEPRRGTNQARERGAEETGGELVAFIDADTRVPPGWSDKIITEFSRDPNLALLSGPYIYYDLPPWQSWLTGLFQWFYRPTASLTGSLSIGGNSVIRRAVLQKMGGLDTSLVFYGDDTDNARRASAFGRVKFDLKFRIGSSGRRLAKQGLFAMAWLYTINFASEMFRRQPATARHPDLR